MMLMVIPPILCEVEKFGILILMEILFIADKVRKTKMVSPGKEEGDALYSTGKDVFSVHSVHFDTHKNDFQRYDLQLMLGSRLSLH